MKPTDADYPAREAVTALVAAAPDASPFCTILNLGQGLHDSLSRGDTGQPGPVVPGQGDEQMHWYRQSLLSICAKELPHRPSSHHLVSVLIAVTTHSHHQVSVHVAAATHSHHRVSVHVAATMHEIPMRTVLDQHCHHVRLQQSTHGAGSPATYGHPPRRSQQPSL